MSFDGHNRHNNMISYDKLPYDWGYLGGALASDGCIFYYHKQRYPAVQLAVSDFDFVEHFTSCAESIIQRRPTINTFIRDNGAIRLTARVYCTQLANTLIAWGAGGGSLGWRVPDIAFQDLELGRGFVNGYFDGDGSISISKGYPWLRFSSINLDGLEDVKSLLEMFGIESSIYHDPKWFSYHLGTYGKKKVRKYWDNIGITPGYKRDKLEAYFK